MAQTGGKGEDVIPGELMAVMPRDPHEQLDLARRITSMAIESQVSQLEAEVVHLRDKMSEKDRAIFELKERLMELDQSFKKADGRLRSVLEENVSVFLSFFKLLPILTNITIFDYMYPCIPNPSYTTAKMITYSI